MVMPISKIVSNPDKWDKFEVSVLGGSSSLVMVSNPGDRTSSCLIGSSAAPMCCSGWEDTTHQPAIDWADPSRYQKAIKCLRNSNWQFYSYSIFSIPPKFAKHMYIYIYMPNIGLLDVAYQRTTPGPLLPRLRPSWWCFRFPWWFPQWPAATVRALKNWENHGKKTREITTFCGILHR